MRRTTISLLAGVALLGPAAAHDLDDDPRATEWLRSQVSPGGTPCCSEQDCFLTEWRVSAGHVEGLLADGKTWVALPPEARLPSNRYGRLLLCWNYGKVLCWAMGAGT